MTQQYLIGELSVRLEVLQAATAAAAAVDVARLRHEVETARPAALGAAAASALTLADANCWDSLDRGDIAAFELQAGICAELRQFAVCARLLRED